MNGRVNKYIYHKVIENITNEHVEGNEDVEEDTSLLSGLLVQHWMWKLGDSRLDTMF